MGTSVSRAIQAHVRTIFAALAALALALTFAPSALFADDSVAASSAQAEASSGVASSLLDQVNASTDLSSNEVQQVSASQDADDSRVAPMLASGLFGTTTSFVRSDVVLDAADPIVGSFTVDGLTFALNDSGVTLVAVSSDPQQVTDYQNADDSRVALMLASGQVAIPSTVTYNDITYDVVAIGPYAFYLSGAASVALPGSIVSVDDRAFRSSDVACVEVAADNPNIASFDGCLYDSQLTSLLLIPEGRAGAVLLPETADVAEPSKFSHCSLVDAISVEEGGADFASWEGLLYDASGTTLLRVPAGATDITIRDGCTTIAAGALEGCAKLEHIDAPASVTSISPDVFESVPTISLPAQMAVQDGTNPGVASDLPDQVNESADSSGVEGEAEVSPRRVVAESQGLSAPLALPDLGSTSTSPSPEASGSAAPQLTAMVALSTADDDLPEVDPSSIKVALPNDVDQTLWSLLGFSLLGVEHEAAIQDSATYGYSGALYVVASETFICNNNLELSWKYRDSYGNPEHLTADGENYKWTGDCVDFLWDGTRRQVGIGSPTSGVTSVYSSLHGNLEKGKTYYRNGSNDTLYLNGSEVPILTWDPNGGEVDPLQSQVTYGGDAQSPVPRRPGFKCTGWYTEAEGGNLVCLPGESILAIKVSQTFHAQWERVDYNLGFDTSSEPVDDDYPGGAKPDQTVIGDQIAGGEQMPIEDPKRPGYVFEGWVIPSGDGTEAVDQELVYQGDDGKWYVDASKLPDYAGDDGRVELTARWTSVISVDVPSSVTFYADLVTQGQESREGAASSAFGQSKVANQSQVDLRVVGLESSAVETEGSTLGADSILKKADAATPSTSAGKLLSLYPSTKQWTADELQDPDAVGGSKPASVDFDLDDILLEKSFKADDFTIAAGGTLNMGYRLNLSETGQQLDYDKLSTLQEGQSASIANVSYCFSADMVPVFWTIDDDGDTLNVFDIKNDAKKISAGDAATIQKYTTWMNSDHRFYVRWFDKGIAEESSHGESSSTVYEVRILGLNHDTKADGSGRAGITFQLVNCLNQTYPFVSGSSVTSWSASSIRVQLNSGAIWSQMPTRLRDNLEMVTKVSYDKGSKLSTQDKVFLISLSELITPGTVWPDGTDTAANGWGELAQMRTVNPQYAFWKAKGINGKESNSLLVKQVNGAASLWVTRSVSFAKDSSVGYAASVNNTGIPNGSGTISNQQKVGISPVFCL